MSANPLLSIEGLTASVDEKTILHNVNLNVAAGETHVLMGPNGAGKSTLGHLVMGDPVYTVNDGRIVFDGQDITELTTDKRSRAGLFLSFQAPVEIPGVPLSSFLRASIAGRPGLEMKGKEFRRRVKELAAELNMDTSYLNRELGVGFSGGEKKKVEMLQLLLLQPKLAILDETTPAWTSTRFPPSATAWTPTARAATAPCSSSRTTRASWSTWMSTASTLWSRVTSCARTTPRSSPGSTRTALRPSSARPPSSAPRPRPPLPGSRRKGAT